MLSRLLPRPLKTVSALRALSTAAQPAPIEKPDIKHTGVGLCKNHDILRFMHLHGTEEADSLTTLEMSSIHFGRFFFNNSLLSYTVLQKTAEWEVIKHEIGRSKY